MFVHDEHSSIRIHRSTYIFLTRIPLNSNMRCWCYHSPFFHFPSCGFFDVDIHLRLLILAISQTHVISQLFCRSYAQTQTYSAFILARTVLAQSFRKLDGIPPDSASEQNCFLSPFGHPRYTTTSRASKRAHCDKVFHRYRAHYAPTLISSYTLDASSALAILQSAHIFFAVSPAAPTHSACFN